MSEEQSLPLLLTLLTYIHVGDDAAAFQAQPEGLELFLRPASLSVAYVE